MRLDELLEIENRYRLLDLQIDGFHFWTYNRFAVYKGFVEKETPSNRFSASSTKSAFDLIRLALSFPQHRISHNVKYMFISGGMRVQEGTRYINKYVDPLLSCLPDGLLYEIPYEGKHFTPTCSPKVVYDEFYTLGTSFLCNMWMKTHKRQLSNVMQQMKEQLDAPIREMESVKNTNIDVDQIVADMIRQYSLYPLIKKAYTRVLNKLTPKTIVIICHYSFHKMIFTELAKERGIPVVELQHGEASEEHPAYNYFQKMEMRQFPDYFLTFSDFWNECARFPITADYIISVGFPYLEDKTQKIRNTTEKKKQTILFLSQPASVPLLSEFAIKLGAAIDPACYRILFKFHPADRVGWETRYPQLVNAHNVEVVDELKPDLYELLQQSLCSVAAIGTTAVFESLLFDVPVLIYYPHAQKELLKLCELGYAHGFGSFEEFQNLVFDDSIRKTQKTKEFWKRDAKNNTIKALETISEGILGKDY